VTDDIDLTRLTAITIFVADIARTTEFYNSVFATQPIFADADSSAYRFGSVIVNLLVGSEAGELITPAKVGDSGSGVRFQLTVDVADTDAAVDLAVSRGARLLNGPIDRPWGPRTAAFADPDGHVWELAADKH
jgi:catechol 2,3-dioxygenase-like lactoylglutathione lyase family enzyme